jgi:hypothetical protein
MALSIVVAIVVVILVSSVLFIYFSPKYSWNSAIRDHDGDGVPDKSDLRPYDGTNWTSGTATVVVNLVSNHTHNVSVILYFDGWPTGSVELAPQGARSWTIEQTLAIGYPATSPRSLVISAAATYDNEGTQPAGSDQETITVYSGNTYSVNLALGD